MPKEWYLLCVLIAIGLIIVLVALGMMFKEHIEQEKRFEADVKAAHDEGYEKGRQAKDSEIVRLEIQIDEIEKQIKRIMELEGELDNEHRAK